jgi:hypothetical protein
MPCEPRDSVVVRGGPPWMITGEDERTLSRVADPLDVRGTDDRIPLLDRSCGCALPRLFGAPLPLVRDGNSMIQLRLPVGRSVPDLEIPGRPPSVARMPVLDPEDTLPPLRTAPGSVVERRASNWPVSVCPTRACADLARVSVERAMPSVARAPRAPPFD